MVHAVKSASETADAPKNAAIITSRATPNTRDSIVHPAMTFAEPMKACGSCSNLSAELLTRLPESGYRYTFVAGSVAMRLT